MIGVNDCQFPHRLLLKVGKIVNSCKAFSNHSAPDTNYQKRKFQEQGN